MWAEKRRGMARPKTAGAAPRADPARRPPGQPPPGCHELHREGDALSRTACGRTAKRAKWSALASNTCPLNQHGD
eukprot:6636567-Lingulodinium_polyedra.AAC.1